jgi:uncharacterized protein with PQ loop repeat
MNDIYIEWIGYTASFLVAVSFIFRKIKYLRLVNSVGCFLFVIYGYFIDSYPVMIANLFILIMNIYHLKSNKDIINFFTGRLIQASK